MTKGKVWGAITPKVSFTRLQAEVVCHRLEIDAPWDCWVDSPCCRCDFGAGTHEYYLTYHEEADSTECPGCGLIVTGDDFSDMQWDLLDRFKHGKACVTLQGPFNVVQEWILMDSLTESTFINASCEWIDDVLTEARCIRTVKGATRKMEELLSVDLF